jgi:hypothetical protein
MQFYSFSFILASQSSAIIIGITIIYPSQHQDTWFILKYGYLLLIDLVTVLVARI